MVGWYLGFDCDLTRLMTCCHLIHFLSKVYGVNVVNVI